MEIPEILGPSISVLRAALASQQGAKANGGGKGRAWGKKEGLCWGMGLKG